ncbi:hypothetical protein [Crassaminicella indica]|uniref:Uncharacterized protein n=1 Tax=Crassaminicella indica TaxID=2855394 RepID=A0ABX8REX0_9CLOT|nr:hypothetical protein [Crassaminicella indica]QXM05496.1 hypothetical protein KVH43_08910 [Crassaminicella indica]
MTSINGTIISIAAGSIACVVFPEVAAAVKWTIGSGIVFAAILDKLDSRDDILQEELFTETAKTFEIRTTLVVTGSPKRPKVICGKLEIRLVY